MCEKQKSPSSKPYSLTGSGSEVLPVLDSGLQEPRSPPGAAPR
ncbi:hypothetical protein [Kamptonema formosum]|nr:hypothetical protein [Oscillatoria sp. PCC 10802]